MVVLSVTDKRSQGFARKGEDVRSRLQQAALELYSEHGFDRTTTAEIAARVGVTERTFFRYFPDKREVLFDGETELRTALTAAIAAAPAASGALETLLIAFKSTEEMIDAYRPVAVRRHQVIASSPALLERELAKKASLTDALASALRQRGFSKTSAQLAAQAGMAAFGQAALSRLEDQELTFKQHLDRTFHELRNLAASP